MSLWSIFKRIVKLPLNIFSWYVWLAMFAGFAIGIFSK
jgi:hypothetical protein